MPRTTEKRPEFRPGEIAPDGIGVVYFLGSEDEREIKIGYTDNNDKSLARIKAHAGYGLRHYLGFVRGTLANERQLHEYFRAAEVPGKNEIFHASAVIPYLVWLRNQYFVATTLEECRGASFVPMDSSFWLPDPMREVHDLREPDLFVTEPWYRLPDRRVTGDDYYTPKEIIEPVRQFFGGRIDLDPASHVTANEVIRAARFFTKDVNGLSVPWHGRVWLNPPFSAWPNWVDKVRDEVAAGHLEDIVLLAATRTMTAQYFAPLLDCVDVLCIITGRFAFWGVNAADAPPDGHFLMYIGERRAAFRKFVGDALGPVFEQPSRLTMGGQYVALADATDSALARAT